MLTYINLKHSYIILFADDVNIFIEDRKYETVINKLNDYLQNITIWLKSNKLCFNINKTRYMVFHRSRRKQNNELVMIK